MKELINRGTGNVPVRIGILLDNYCLSSWQCDVISSIQTSPHAELVLVVLNEERPTVPGLLRRLYSSMPRILYAIYQRMDRLVFGMIAGREGPQALREVDVSHLLAEVPVRKVTPLRKGPVCRFPGEAIAALREDGLDVLLRFGFGILKGEVLRIPRFGVWSFHHGDNQSYRGSPPLFWEMHEGNPVSGAILQKLTEELDGGEVIYRSFFPTYMYSLYRNQNRIFHQSRVFVDRCLKVIADFGPEYLFSRYPRAACDRTLTRIPGNPAMLTFLWRLGFRLMRYLPERFFLREKWFLAYRRAQAFNPARSAGSGWNIVLAPRGHFYADPFVVKWQGRSAVFFEDFSFDCRKGAIACFEVRPDGFRGEVREVLNLSTHLSYPYVFDYKGNLYLMPEQSSSARLSLWRCVEFPCRWEPAGTLMEGRCCIDASLIQWEERYWLFASTPEDSADSSRELSVFFSESPFGPWSVHPLNPVKSDIRSARPAGRPFVHGGSLYRPVQDCSRRYGGGVSLCRIEELTPQRFKETVVRPLKFDLPLQNLGSHTFNFDEEFEVTDGRRFSLKWLA